MAPVSNSCGSSAWAVGLSVSKTAGRHFLEQSSPALNRTHLYKQTYIEEKKVPEVLENTLQLDQELAYFSKRKEE